MFCSLVATQVASHVSGLLYDRRTAVSSMPPHTVLHNLYQRIQGTVFFIFPVLLDGDDL